MNDTLKFALPTGSLQPRLIKALRSMGYSLRDTPDKKGCFGTSNGITFYKRDRRIVPQYVAGNFDAGITGEDLLLNRHDHKEVKELEIKMRFKFSRVSNTPTRWVIAGKEPVFGKGTVALGCELEYFAIEMLSRHNLPDCIVVPIDGDEELAIEDGICDLVLVVTETGGALAEAGLQIVPGCENLFESYPVLIAKPNLSEEKQSRLKELSAAIAAAIAAKDRVMATFNLPAANVETLSLPSSQSPTVNRTSDPNWVAVQICIERNLVPQTLVAIADAGGTGQVIQEISGFSL